MSKRFHIFRLIKEPTKAYNGDAGFDCFLPDSIILQPHSVAKIDLGFSVDLKKNEFALICVRSSVSMFNVIANTSPIDSGYKGPVHLILHNLSNNDIRFEEEMRICQIIIIKTKYSKGIFGKRYKKSFGSSGSTKVK